MEYENWLISRAAFTLFKQMGSALKLQLIGPEILQG